MWKIEELREKNMEIMGKKLFDKNDPNTGRMPHTERTIT